MRGVSKVEYIYSGISLQNKRISNMDSLLMKSKKINGSAALLVVVCDGVGSTSDGAFASGETAKRLGEWFDNLEDTGRIGLKMRDEARRINSEITASAAAQELQTASTLSAVLFVGEVFFIVHIGDSRVFSFDGKTLSQLTNDDVSDSGKLTAYIGLPDNMTLQYSEGQAGGKAFIVCSDGLYKRMDVRFMMSSLNADSNASARASVNALAQFVIDRGEQDNITVALMKTIN